jgi:membrane protease YdiL (CAAX protease family)
VQALPGFESLSVRHFSFTAPVGEINMKRALLPIEFFLLCIVLPAVIIIYRLAPFMGAFLWGAALYCFLVLRFRYKAYLYDLWKWRAVTWANMKPMLVRFFFACIGMLVFMYFYDPERMFRLLMERPQMVPFLLVLYPILSGLPQEFIFCGFFFKRYERLFSRELTMIIVSAVVFAFAHILYINWVAPFFSFIAGIIFATTFAKTRSLALVAIEHGLYGNALFLIGMGWYFYSGAVVAP